MRTYVCACVAIRRRTCVLVCLIEVRGYRFTLITNEIESNGKTKESRLSRQQMTRPPVCLRRKHSTKLAPLRVPRCRLAGRALTWQICSTYLDNRSNNPSIEYRRRYHLSYHTFFLICKKRELYGEKRTSATKRGEFALMSEKNVEFNFLILLHTKPDSRKTTS